MSVVFLILAKTLSSISRGGELYRVAQHDSTAMKESVCNGWQALLMVDGSKSKSSQRRGTAFRCKNSRGNSYIMTVIAGLLNIEALPSEWPYEKL